MNKREFLRRLDIALVEISPAERAEILKDYAAHFEESLANGRDETLTAEALGDPDGLAKAHLADTRTEGGRIKATAKRILFRIASPRHPSGDTVERLLAWAPGRAMSIDLPVVVRWQPAQTARAVVRGPSWLVEHVRLENEQLHGRFKPRFFSDNQISVDLEGPSIESWALRGSGELTLLNVAQPSLRLALDGSGDIKAAGRVDELLVTMEGTGDVDTSMLAAANAKVDVTGHGDLTIAPSGVADIASNGGGDVVLLTRPTKLTTHVKGGGAVKVPR
ncbi:hypothetical protein PAN31117_04697 [Pandoraea anapnoica]|uniref:Putative auto-transporter adhesin head GIN domain-containing protein n=1 Tax=Pandoraea anapnoica TaxID=2508301 RepID=A0A5E5AJE8_9BURK|nr:DUF2807 domain-containing protein [Pandoraea anapnoica]VVE73388.1 hypothetical protein PAN31117_04697 [Pandoraea anapnoica]